MTAKLTAAQIENVQVLRERLEERIKLKYMVPGPNEEHSVPLIDIYQAVTILWNIAPGDPDAADEWRETLYQAFPELREPAA